MKGELMDFLAWAIPLVLWWMAALCQFMFHGTIKDGTAADVSRQISILLFGGIFAVGAFNLVRLFLK